MFLPEKLSDAAVTVTDDVAVKTAVVTADVGTSDTAAETASVSPKQEQHPSCQYKSIIYLTLQINNKIKSLITSLQHPLFGFRNKNKNLVWYI